MKMPRLAEANIVLAAWVRKYYLQLQDLILRPTLLVRKPGLPTVLYVSSKMKVKGQFVDVLIRTANLWVFFH
jgi:hypothetical protein